MCKSDLKAKQTEFSLLIPTMNRPETLEITLRAVMRSSVLPNEIIIVDQSTDLSKKEMVKQLVHSFGEKLNVRYFYQPVPSLTKARNKAVRFSSCDIVVFSDDDVEFEYSTFENVINLMFDNQVALVGGIDNSAKISNSKIGYLLGSKDYNKRYIGHVTKSVLGRFPIQLDEATDTEWAMGFFFAVRKSRCVDWNIFWDENLSGYAYAEDLDFSYRYCKMAKKNGEKCVFSNKVTVNHLESKEYRIPTKRNSFMYVGNRIYIANKLGELKERKKYIYWCDFWRAVYDLLVGRKEEGFNIFKALVYFGKKDFKNISIIDYTDIK